MFRWLWRQRIRLHLEGTGINPTPVDLHEQQLSLEQHSQAHRNTTVGLHQRMTPPLLTLTSLSPVCLTHMMKCADMSYTDHVEVLFSCCVYFECSDVWFFPGTGTLDESFSKPSILPIRSLNEIFIGESLSSRYLCHPDRCMLTLSQRGKCVRML